MCLALPIGVTSNGELHGGSGEFSAMAGLRLEERNKGGEHGGGVGAHGDLEEQLRSLRGGVTVTDPSTVFCGKRLKTTPISTMLVFWSQVRQFEDYVLDGGASGSVSVAS